MLNTRTIPGNNMFQGGSTVLAFIVGMMVGGCFGVFVMCLMVVAGDADRRMEQYLTEQDPKEQPNP